MVLFKVGIFNFDFASLIALIIGIGLGISLSGLVYAILVLLSIKPKKYVVESKEEVSDVEIKEIIDNATNAFNDKTLQGEKSTIAHCKDVCINLTWDIARKFFPESKHPSLELTIDEALVLVGYVSNKLDEILSKKALRLVRKMKIATIVSLNDTKKHIDESALMQMTKKYKIKQIFNTVKSALNVVNPIYWVRKLVVSKSMDFAIHKLCMVIIGITGEEVYKIYSKNVFNEDRTIDSGALELVDEINDELETYSDEELEEYVNNQDELKNIPEGVK